MLLPGGGYHQRHPTVFPPRCFSRKCLDGARGWFMDVWWLRHCCCNARRLPGPVTNAPLISQGDRMQAWQTCQAGVTAVSQTSFSCGADRIRLNTVYSTIVGVWQRRKPLSPSGGFVVLLLQEKRMISQRTRKHSGASHAGRTPTSNLISSCFPRFFSPFVIVESSRS